MTKTGRKDGDDKRAAIIAQAAQRAPIRHTMKKPRRCNRCPYVPAQKRRSDVRCETCQLTVSCACVRKTETDVWVSLRLWWARLLGQGPETRKEIRCRGKPERPKIFQTKTVATCCNSAAATAPDSRTECRSDEPICGFLSATSGRVSLLQVGEFAEGVRLQPHARIVWALPT